MTQPFPALHIIAVIATLIFFAYSAVTDAKHLTVPIHYCPYVYCAALVDLAINKSLWPALYHIASAAIVFALLYCMARFLGGGGGDAISIPLLALLHGLPLSLIVLLGACGIIVIGALLKAAVTKQRPELNQSYPLTTGIAIAYGLALFCMLLLPSPFVF